MRLLKEPEGLERMVLFYKLVGRLYSNIVFAEVPRLHADGFRWAPSTFLFKDERRPHTDLKNPQQGVDCTEHGLLGTYTTFSVAADKDGHRAVHYDGSGRVTLLVKDNNSEKNNHQKEHSFDMLPSEVDAGNARDFWFTHIIIYPDEKPDISNKDITIVAAAVLEVSYGDVVLEKDKDKDQDNDSLANEYHRDNPPPPPPPRRCHAADFVAVYQSMIHLVWRRDRDYPVSLSYFPHGGLDVPCTSSRQTLLLR